MSVSPLTRIFPDKYIMASAMAADFVSYLVQMGQLEVNVYVALSGGSTPTLLFRATRELQPVLNWDHVHFFWVDERCVPPDHPESNFGEAYREFLLPLGIPESSYHRIRGENDPEAEARRYAEEIMDIVSPEMDFPEFNRVLLGMGADGHTASIFPGQMHLWNSESLCTVGVHPQSGQKRVTFTGHLINAAKRVDFMVSGKQKNNAVKSVLESSGDYKHYPASLVAPHHGELTWYLDEEAAGNIGT
jgi:6-phosphogluconolactonase